MKLAPTGVGAEPKKLAALGAILVAAGGIYWFETRSDSPTVSASVTPSQALPATRQIKQERRSINDAERRTAALVFLAAAARAGSIG